MKFNDCWKIPKDAKHYFSPTSEKIMKEKYGIWYYVHIFMIIIIVIIPFIVFLSLLPESAYQTTTESGEWFCMIGAIVGLIGSLSISAGLGNIYMIVLKEYLGHIVTLITIIGGLLLNTLAWFLFSIAV